MMIIDRIDSAATRAQIRALSALQDAAHHMTVGRGGDAPTDPADPEEGPPPWSTRSGPSRPRDLRDSSS